MIKLLLKQPLFLMVVFLFVSLGVLGQTKLREDAETAYNSGDFETALTLYGEVLKSYPTNSIYNHRYGVALFETNTDIDLAEKHLKISSGKGIRYSNYYLGKVYLRKYEFQRAIKYIEAYSRYLRPSDERQNAVKADLERCKQGLELIKQTEQITILDTMVVDKSDFTRYYELSPASGSFSQLDINAHSVADSLFVLFTTERKDRCYYSRINAKNGSRDLVMRDKLIDSWSEEKNLGEFINTDGNEVLPFVSSDGMTLYFASDAHNSFGGYDIFVTRYNPSTSTFLPPRALGMPFNSLGNDLFYVIDETRKIGWFASDRHNKQGKITIYKFLPAGTKEFVGDEDELELRKAALLKDFRFEENHETVFISSETALKRQEDRNTSGIVHFILNDTTIYTSLNDFESLKARKSYEIFQKLNLQSDSVSHLMNAKRIAYGNTDDEATRKAIADQIIALETEHFNFKEAIQNQEKETRKLEWEMIRGQLVNTDDETAPWEEPPLQINIPTTVVPTFINKDLDNIYKDIFNIIEIKELQRAEEIKLQADNLVLKWQETLNALNENEDASPQKVFSDLIHRDSSFTEEPAKEEIAKNATKLRNQSTVKYSEAHTSRYHTLLNKVQLDAEQLSDKDLKHDIYRLVREAKFNFYDAGPLNNPKNSFSHYNFDQVKEALGKLERANDYLERAVLRIFKNKVDNGEKKISESAYDTLMRLTKSKDVSKSKFAVPSASKQEAKDTLPDLFYKVQIGLYRGKPKEELVKKIPPISFEFMEDKKLKRYYSGYYTNKQEAIEKAMELDAIGFPGAFVVPYVKGKRSSWTEVRQFLKSK